MFQLTCQSGLKSTKTNFLLLFPRTSGSPESSFTIFIKPFVSSQGLYIFILIVREVIIEHGWRIHLLVFSALKFSKANWKQSGTQVTIPNKLHYLDS